jgi:peptidoglycan/LPS O-acetylase OafA/YrhL
MTRALSLLINKMSRLDLILLPQTHNGSWKPHIDGLRAISVLAVVFYHSGAFNVSGGFIGVDVFFVISGFLISRIVYGDLQRYGKFRVIDFYERRARRILPTFIFVTAATLICGYLIFLPDDFADLGHSAEYASAFAANIYFYHVTGYFGGLAISLPLLHYWSLGVEEQFYIVFPVTVLIINKAAPRLVATFILLILGVSLALAEFYLKTDPNAAFFLTGPRAWELLVGSALALPNFPLLNKACIVK